MSLLPIWGELQMQAIAGKCERGWPTLPHACAVIARLLQVGDLWDRLPSTDAVVLSSGSYS